MKKYRIRPVWIRDADAVVYYTIEVHSWTGWYCPFNNHCYLTLEQAKKVLAELQAFERENQP